MYTLENDDWRDHLTPAHIESLKKAFRVIENRRAKRKAAAMTAPADTQQPVGDETSDGQTSAEDRAPSE